MARPQGSPRDLEQRRLKAWNLLRAGAAPVEVARRLKVGRRTVRRWRADGELRRLHARPRTGRPPWIPRNVLFGLLRTAVRNHHEAAWDTHFGRWVRRRSLDRFISDVVATGMRASRSTVYAWLSGRRWPGLSGLAHLSRATHGRLDVDDIFEHFVVASRRRVPLTCKQVAELLQLLEVRYHIRHVRRLLRQLSGQFMHGLSDPGVAIKADAIYKWLAGTREPRTLATVQALLRISKGAIKLSDIIEHRETLRRRAK